MLTSDWWDQATRRLTPDELGELERLLEARRKRASASKSADRSSAPSGPQNGMQQYFSSVRGDPLADFRGISGVPEPTVFVDGV
jgi:hypothetical protein